MNTDRTSMPVVAWLGLGAMGLPMARRLVAAGYPVRAYDPHRERLEALAPTYVAVDAADAARGSTVLVLMVATPEQADEALVDRGALDALEDGGTVVVLSTVGMTWVAGLAARAPRGVRVVDAPVSGGVVRAGDGSLLVMAAALDDTSRRLLQVFGDVVEVGDDAGQGQAMKMVNQVLCGIHIAAAAEALALADGLGLDPVAALETVRRGAGASFMLDDRGRRMAEHDGDGASEVRSALALFVKDLDLVAEASRTSGVSTGVAAAAARLFAEAAAERGADHDDTELYDFLRSR